MDVKVKQGRIEREPAEALVFSSYEGERVLHG